MFPFALQRAPAGGGYDRGRVRPADECPYEKPFPADFSVCPAYAPRTYIALDLQYRPLPPVWTCNRLKMRRGSSGGGFYACCSLGDEASRVAYAASLESDRVVFMKRIRAESVALSTPFLEELWRLKGRELVATRRGDREAAALSEMQLQEAAERFNQAVDAHFDSYAEDGAKVGIEVAALAEMSRSYVGYMIASGTTVNNWTVPEAVLARFPEDVGRLLKGEGTLPDQISQSPERVS